MYAHLKNFSSLSFAIAGAQLIRDGIFQLGALEMAEISTNLTFPKGESIFSLGFN
jgi:hypothetical protein